MKLLSPILKYPKAALAILLTTLIILSTWATSFQIDASAETLINKNDLDYITTTQVAKRYNLEDALVLVFRPDIELFTPEGLSLIHNLKTDLSNLEGVTGITTLLDVPLLKSSSKKDPSKKGSITLTDKNTDLKKAKEEMRTNPLYKDLLISKSGDTTGMQLSVDSTQMSAFETKHALLNRVRAVVDSYKPHGMIYLGGLEVIADDMIGFIKTDLKTFGAGVFLCMLVILWIIFRKPRWIALAITCCAASVLAMMGLLSLFDLKVTVVSSNFISLQIILTMSLAIHLIVHFLELQEKNPKKPQAWLIEKTVEEKFTPSAFAVLTTITGFASLLMSGIVPVEAFGWMMISGLIVSFIVTFTLFITVLSLLPKTDLPKKKKSKTHPITALATLTDKQRWKVLVLGIILLSLGGYGMARLEVENSFINYFKSTTELHRGLAFIDKSLGGTTPLTLTLTLPSTSTSSPQSEDDTFTDFEEFEEEVSDTYWLTGEKVALAKKVHDYLESSPYTGKVLSIWTTVQVAEIINNAPLGDFELAVMTNILPQDLRSQLWDPYVSIPNNEFRFTLRMLDSNPDLRRNTFLNQVERDLQEELGLSRESFKLSGAMVLYNNMLQRLFSSQILTLGLVLIAILVMLLLLFRNLIYALAAIIPNILSVFVILGFMGLSGIPLDMMTITIAAITIGIAIDDAIHYIYRYKTELSKDGDHIGAMTRAHASVGHAMFFTTLTIGIGFGFLVLSNFIPNILFGLLTALAMTIALLGSLTLLSLTLILLKPKK